MEERRSSSLQRGLVLRARKPLASTSPRAEFCSSWLTTSGPGMVMRHTPSTSSSNLGGATRDVLRLIKRSMTSANARMEQATRGQMGQPAACMIENKWNLRADEKPRDYRPPAGFFRVKSAAGVTSRKRFFSMFIPQNLWITLWKTLLRCIARPRRLCLVTDR